MKKYQIIEGQLICLEKKCAGHLFELESGNGIYCDQCGRLYSEAEALNIAARELDWAKSAVAREQEAFNFVSKRLLEAEEKAEKAESALSAEKSAREKAESELSEIKARLAGITRADLIVMIDKTITAYHQDNQELNEKETNNLAEKILSLIGGVK